MPGTSLPLTRAEPTGSTNFESLRSVPTDVHLPLSDGTSHQPPEVIAAIFGNILSGIVWLPPSVDRSPWVLGQVCSRWRKILWNQPSSWNQIIIQASSIPSGRRGRRAEDKATRRIQAIGESLSYIVSNTHTPLSLSIHDYNLNSLPDVILSNSHRFWNLSLGQTSQTTFVALVNLPPQSLIHLESLSISFPVVDASLLPNTSALKTAPNLRSVKYMICNQSAIYYPQIINLPFEKMTTIHVELMPIPLDTVQNILASSPCLVSCVLVLMESSMLLDKRQITMSRLETLHFESSSTVDWYPFFTSFSTPVLEDMTILFPSLPLREITSLLSRSECSVSHLKLHGEDGTEPEEIEMDTFIQQLPSSVVSLHMSGDDTPGSIFRKIQQGLLPMLETLELRIGSDGLEALADLLNSYVDGTASAGRSLKDVEVHYVCEDSGLVERCKEWAESWAKIEGLRLSLYDPIGNTNLMEMDDSEDGW